MKQREGIHEAELSTREVELSTSGWSYQLVGEVIK